MNADFLDAHRRHMVDAKTLFLASRLANADQLYSFAAECGLKKLMSSFGMLVTPDGSPTDRADRVHADTIWARYESYRSTNIQIRSMIGEHRRDTRTAMTSRSQEFRLIEPLLRLLLLWLGKPSWRG